ncbi:putative capsid protein [Beihai sobemo-like virus 8]|uniref:putative capsid protein n=1 Tax=Beihai sobemo-like virus 8 TaxID=1922705 RepID=UPI00090B4ED7|nr:putative capsid protein [Beihai sobemo-like virus 8]APG75713.1 putative capsid protein [Beihai sobemo-like virus 8]
MARNGRRPDRPPRRNRRPPFRRGGRRSTAERVQAQGVGCVAPVPFGGKRVASIQGWNAFSPAHLPLPRSVGPYCIVRTTTRVFSNKKFVTITCTLSEDGTWQAVCGFAEGDLGFGSAIDGANNTQVLGSTFPGLTAGAGTSAITVVPSALSVQILNGEALQTTNGILAAGVVKTQLALQGRTETWEAFSNRFLAYMAPRLMSAGKLALKGVQMNSYPLNMNVLSYFAPLDPTVFSGNITWKSGENFQIYPEGWAPMCILNQDAVDITYLIAQEWRVRFDLANPAASAHRHHGVTSDGLWDKMVSMASALGHGVQDLPEFIANVGSAARAANQTLRMINAGTHYLPMLTG